VAHGGPSKDKRKTGRLLIPESFVSLAALREKQSSETEETHMSTDL